MTEAEYKKFTDYEKRIQGQMDIFYKQCGFSIKRNGNTTYDLLLDGIRYEEKIRSEIRDDILVELIQNLPTRSPGWIFTVDAEYLNYIMCEFGEAAIMYKIVFLKFKTWFLSEYFVSCPRGEYIISPKGRGITLNIPVKIGHIPNSLYETSEIIKQLQFI